MVAQLASSGPAMAAIEERTVVHFVTMEDMWLQQRFGVAPGTDKVNGLSQHRQKLFEAMRRKV